MLPGSACAKLRDLADWFRAKATGGVGPQAMFALMRQAGELLLRALETGEVVVADAEGFLAWARQETDRERRVLEIPVVKRWNPPVEVAHWDDPFGRVFVAFLEGHFREAVWVPVGGFGTWYTRGMNDSQASVAWSRRALELANGCDAIANLEQPSAKRGNRSGSTTKGRAPRRKPGTRTRGNRVRELLSGEAPYEGTKTELAAAVGYTHPSALRNVKNFKHLWSENERRLAARRAERERRMIRPG